MHFTIVTAFISLEKYGNLEKRRTKDDFINHARAFTLSLPFPLYCFLEKENVDEVLNIRNKLGLGNLTRIITVDFNQLPLALYMDKLSSFPRTNNKFLYPSKNPAYPIIINSKSYFLRQAISENKYKSEYFMWVDFAANSKKYTLNTIDSLKRMMSKPYPKVAIGVFDPKKIIPYEVLMVGIHYVSVGTIFTLSKNSEEFLDLWDKEEIKAINSGLYPFEESIFYYLTKQRPDLFNVIVSTYETYIQKYIE